MLWQKSPQYQNMPHDEYMKTAEGQQSQQAFRDWGQWMKQTTQQAKQRSAASSPSQPMGDSMSYDQSTGTYKPWTPTQQSGPAAQRGFASSSPGAAQPKRQSIGTAYNPSAGQPFSAWAQKPANAPETWRPNGMRDNMLRPASAGMAQTNSGIAMPPRVSDWMQSQAGQVFAGGPTMPPDVRQSYDQWYNSANTGTYSGSAAFQPGGTWDSGPVPGTQMYRPPANQSPYGKPLDKALVPGRDYDPVTGEVLDRRTGQPTGQFMEGPSSQQPRPPSQPGQRTPVTRPTPGRAPGQASAYPAALPPSSQPYYDEVMRQFPGMSPFDAADMANRVRSQQEQQLRDVTNPVKPMPAERTPEQIAYGQQQQRQREQSQERQRQKMRQQEARNNAQRMDPNWENNQARDNAARVQERRRKEEEQKWEPSRPALQKLYWEYIAGGSSPEKARKTADQFL